MHALVIIKGQLSAVVIIYSNDYLVLFSENVIFPYLFYSNRPDFIISGRLICITDKVTDNPVSGQHILLSPI